MSHTITVYMSADQEISIAGKKVNIHNIDSIIVNADGLITNAFLRTEDGHQFGWIVQNDSNPQ